MVKNTNKIDNSTLKVGQRVYLLMNHLSWVSENQDVLEAEITEITKTKVVVAFVVDDEVQPKITKVFKYLKTKRLVHDDKAFSKFYLFNNKEDAEKVIVDKHKRLQLLEKNKGALKNLTLEEQEKIDELLTEMNKNK